MRPVVRGPWPLENGAPIVFKEYAEARGELIERMGEYCSYCEMQLDASLAVEHVKPKKPAGAQTVNIARALDWDNFLLACSNCNSTKGSKDINVDDYLWPDKDNTFRGITYSTGGKVTTNRSLGLDIQMKAENIIMLVGLDKNPSNDPTVSDRRWNNRREAWDMAVMSKQNLAICDKNEMRTQILLTAKAKGYWSIWMTVFKDMPDMLKLFIDAFPGTDTSCFDSTQRFILVQRNGGIC
jgi:uncharacterized protein (TIGR02646 family)